MLTREPCVYVLASGFNGTLYIGVTSDLLARLHQHREGTFGGFTSRHKVTRLVWFEQHETMPAAITAEKRIKRWPRDYKKNLIERDNPRWDDLAVALGFEPLTQPSGGPRHMAGVTEVVSASVGASPR